MLKQPACLIVVAVLLTAGVPAQCADGVLAKLTRWAILAPSPVGDFLTVELSKRNDIELVERAEIDKALTELRLSATMVDATAAQRLALCSLLHADRLLAISESQPDKDDPQSEIRSIRVFDSQFGAMLASAEIVLPKDSPMAAVMPAVRFVDDVQARFALGINAIVGVSYFVSRNFDRSFDHLQEDYANVVSRSLLLQPGIAVVALEELSAIQRELAISGDTDNLFGRTVPVFVEGEYTIHLPEQAEPGGLNPFSSANRISLKVIIKSPQQPDTTQPDTTIEKATIEPKEAAELLSVTLPNEILKRIGGSASFTVAQQIEEFKRQAERSAAVGALELALRYREAVFMLDPDDTDNALRLVIPFGPGRGPMTDRYRALPYIEHLLRSKKLTQFQGLQLVWSTTVTTWVPFERDTKTHDRIYENDPLGIGPDYLFFRRLVPYLFELPSPPGIHGAQLFLNEHISRTFPDGRILRYLTGDLNCRLKASLFNCISDMSFPKTYFPQARDKEYSQEEAQRIWSAEGFANQRDEWVFEIHTRIQSKTVQFALDRSGGPRYVELLRESGDRDYILYADVIEIRLALPNLWAQSAFQFTKHPLTEQQYRDILTRIQALLKEHDPEGIIPPVPDDNVELWFGYKTDRPEDAFTNLLKDLKIYEKQLLTLFLPSIQQGIPIDLMQEGGPRLRGTPTPATTAEQEYIPRAEALGAHEQPPRSSDAIPSNPFGKPFEGKMIREIGRIGLRDNLPVFFPAELYEDDTLKAAIRAPHHTYVSRNHVFLFEKFDFLTDIFWNSNHMFKIIRDASGNIRSEQINIDMSEFAPRQKIMMRVRSDGHNLWIATVDGIDVVSIDGERLARFSKDIMPPFEINVNNMIQVSYPPGTVLRNETDGALWLEDGRDMTEELREDIRYRLTVFPTAPSEALAVGRGGPLGQTWIGKLTFDEKSGEQSFKLLLGTTRHLPTEDYLKPDVLAAHEQKDVVFSFPWICPFPDSKNPDLRQVLIGRVHGNGYQFGNVPLLVDLDTGEVMVITERYPDLHDFRYGIVVRCVNDCLVVIDGNRQLYVHYRGDDGTYRRDRIASRRSFALYVDGDRVYSPSGQFYSISGPNFSYYTIATTEIDLSAKKPISKSVEVRQTKHRDHVFYAPSAVFGNILLTTEQLIHTIETSVVPTAEPSMVHTIEPSMVHTTETDAVHPPAPPFTEIVSGDLLENPNASVESNRSLGGELLFVYVLVFMFALSLVVGLWLRRLYLIAYNVPANTSDRVQQIRTLIFVAVLLTAGVPAQSDVRIAIVPGGDPKPHELLVLTEAQLFELQEIELLDRTDIDKVLAEQRLSGMFSADNAVALGQILKTDMFVVLETKSVVIFDAHTGLRFIDETLPEKLPETLPNTLDDAIEVAVDAVKSAVEKRQKLTDETLVTFGVLEVRNADFPVARDAWCRAVGVILERSLLQRGGAVLERSRLQLVNQERQLPGDATNRLLASMKLINLEFTRVESLQSFRLTARVGNERFSVEGSFDAPLEAVHKLSEQLLGGNVRGVNRAATEAVRFAAEARFFLNSNKLDEALEKIEVAVALDPENPDHRRQLTRILSDHIRSRISNPNNRTFRYDTELNVNRLDAEAMRQAVQDIERLEALQGTVPGLIRRDIGILANHVLPEFKDVVREFNRRDLNREHARYREALNNVVDQETFQEYLRFLASSGYQDTLDLVPIRVEIVENTLRLSQEYGIEERVASLLKNFPSFVRRTYAERIAETAPDAAAQIEQTILLIEQDSRLVPQTCAWIARNRTIDVDRNVAARTAYFNLVKSYLANFPKEAELYESMILYDELMEILRRAEQSRILGRVGGESTFSLLRQLTEIIELADLRGEFVQDTVYDYIRWVVLINQESTDKTELLKLKEQFDPMIFRQFALAERQGIRQENIDNLRQQATRAGITETPQTVVIGRPWKSEINLFPREEGYAKIMTENIVIYNNVLYCEVRNIQSRKYYVACVDLATLEKRYVLSPFADHISSRIAHVDDTNIYLLGGGLHIIPLDGSESWTLTPEDGLPSGAFRVLGTLDGWCYAVLGFDWIIRFNLQTREWEQLSSSRAKEGKTPFVDGRRLERLESIVDPRREQILLAVTRGFNSFWAIQKDGTFVRLNTSQAPLRLIGFSDDQQKLFYNLGQLCAFDLDNKTVTQFGNVWEFSLHAGTAWNGYVWGALDHNGWRWGRKKIADESAFEPLVVPEQITPFPDKDRSLWFPFFCAPTSDGKNLIIASNFEVVLLRFE